MNLKELCRHLTQEEPNLLPPEHKLNERLMCPEYSSLAQEVKTYPLLGENRIFVLCWTMDEDCSLSSTMYPAPKPFRCRQHFADGARTQLHTHDYIELAYIAEGQFTQRILGKDILFSAGDLCLIDRNCLHQDYLFGRTASVLFLGIANDMFAEIMNENITTQKITSFLQDALLRQKDIQQYIHFRPAGDAAGDMERCFCLLLDELCHRNTGSQYICRGLLLRIFRIISTRYEFSLSREQKKAMNWLVFEEISAYMKEHYADITIQDLKNRFHFQEDYFNRLIKAKTGLTYSAFLQQIRLDRAELLLRTSENSVEEISRSIGYNNKGYFYKIFRERFGATPYEYRKKFL